MLSWLWFSQIWRICYAVAIRLFDSNMQGVGRTCTCRDMGIHMRLMCVPGCHSHIYINIYTYTDIYICTIWAIENHTYSDRGTFQLRIHRYSVCDVDSITYRWECDNDRVSDSTASFYEQYWWHWRSYGCGSSIRWWREIDQCGSMNRTGVE